MFILWLIKRAVKPVIALWNRPAIEGKCLTGKILIYMSTVFYGWAVIASVCCVLAWILDDTRYIAFGGFLLIPTILLLCIPDAYEYLSKLYAEYHAEQPDKPKRKRKNDEYIVDSDFLDGYEIDEKEQARQSFEDGYNAAAEFIHGLNLDGE